ncbi:MAG: hypothetical protein AABP62_14880 [Planctomycetota bacterium]
MPPFDPLLWRLAGRLAAHISKISHRTLDIDLAPRSMDAVRQLLDQLHAATERGWHSAAAYLSLQLRSRLTECQTSINAGLKATSPGAFWQSPPTQRLVYDELVAVRADFADFTFDLPDQTISVTTEEITLEDIYLGRFEIRLQGRELGGTPYIIIPESPHFPSSRSDVPHPHVLGERLCEGDASAPLAHALRTGRFSDFFQIIQQTLASYNSESPYVALDAWYGADCHACGGHASDDDSSYCDGCDATVCSDCSRSCQHCGTSGCDACLPQCPECCNDCCSSCLNRCEGCSKLRCPECLTNQLCEDCHAEAATNPDTDEEAADEEAPESDTTLSPDAPLPPDRVGQALVPA